MEGHDHFLLPCKILWSLKARQSLQVGKPTLIRMTFATIGIYEITELINPYAVVEHEFS